MSKLVRELICIVFLIFLVHIAIAVGTFYGPSLNIATGGTGNNSLAAQNLFDRQNSFLQAFRGVLMQSFASFQNISGQTVSIADVSIEEVSTGSERVFCLRIGSDVCGNFLLTPEQVKAILLFVQNGSYGAFTLPDNGPNPERIINQIKEDMVPVNDGFFLDDWIAKELATPKFVRIFRYVDYEGFYSFSSATFEEAIAEDLRKQLNTELGHVNRPSSEIEEETWINTDLHANFAARVVDSLVVCDGLPARYHWVLFKGERYAYVDKIEFAAPVFIDENHKQLYMEAQTVFCTTAILRTLHNSNPEALAPLQK